jgi:hypothetical protein
MSLLNKPYVYNCKKRIKKLSTKRNLVENIVFNLSIKANTIPFFNIAFFLKQAI